MKTTEYKKLLQELRESGVDPTLLADAVLDPSLAFRDIPSIQPLIQALEKDGNSEQSQVGRFVQNAISEAFETPIHKLRSFVPRDLQVQASSAAVAELQVTSRVALEIPPAGGKSYLSWKIAHDLNLPKDTIIVLFVPNHGLVRQMSSDWRKATSDQHSVDPSRSTTFIGVFEQTAAASNETGMLSTTDAAELQKLIVNNRDTSRVIISTYQSSSVVRQSLSSLGLSVGCVFFDEAHRLASDNQWTRLLDDDYFPAQRRVSMTASPKRYTTSRILSYPDYAKLEDEDPEAHQEILEIVGESYAEIQEQAVSSFGRLVYSVSLRDLIASKDVAPYETAGVYTETTSQTIRAFAKEQHVVEAMIELADDDDPDLIKAEQEALRLVSNVFAVKQTFSGLPTEDGALQPCRKMIVFHNHIEKSKLFKRLLQSVCDASGTEVTIYHADGSSSAGRRSLQQFKRHSSGISVLTNAKIAREGFSVNDADSVYYADIPLQPHELYQTLGRVIRRDPLNPAKESLVLVPFPDNEDDDAASQAYERLVGFRMRSRYLDRLTAASKTIVLQPRSEHKILLSDGTTASKIDLTELRNYSQKITARILKYQRAESSLAFRIRLLQLWELCRTAPCSINTVLEFKSYLRSAGFPFSEKTMETNMRKFFTNPQLRFSALLPRNGAVYDYHSRLGSLKAEITSSAELRAEFQHFCMIISAEGCEAILRVILHGGLSEWLRRSQHRLLDQPSLPLFPGYLSLPQDEEEANKILSAFLDAVPTILSEEKLRSLCQQLPVETKDIWSGTIDVSFVKQVLERVAQYERKLEVEKQRREELLEMEQRRETAEDVIEDLLCCETQQEFFELKVDVMKLLDSAYPDFIINELKSTKHDWEVTDIVAKGRKELLGVIARRAAYASARKMT